LFLFVLIYFLSKLFYVVCDTKIYIYIARDTNTEKYLIFIKH
jgi:hypothetical protein